MKYFSMILMIILGVNYGFAIPIAGINIKKNFEIEFNPAPLKSLEFIIEKWSRFGRFGLKHKVAKRDTKIIIDPSQLAFEQDNLHVLPMKTASVTVVPLIKGNEKPLPKLEENIITIPVVEPSIEVTQPVEPFFPVSGEPIIELNVKTTIQQPATTAISPSSANLDIKAVSPPGLYTNILQSLNFPPVNGADNQIIDNLRIPETENTNFIIRGSRLAMYFGTMLLRMLSYYLSGGRTTFATIPKQDLSH